jgi:hypothetical protein
MPAANKQRPPNKLEIRGVFPRIRAWLDSRDLIVGTAGSEKHRQMALRLERLARNIYLGQPERVVFALADLVILATAYAEQLGVPIEECLDHRLTKIQYRDGKIDETGRWYPYEVTPRKKKKRNP